MYHYQYILFDLDGTITDPAEGITTCVRHALHCQGVEEENYQNLCRLIGPPLAEGFQEFYGFDEARAWEAVGQFRELFARIGVEKNIPYTGIREALARLKDAGLTLCVATSKPEEFAQKIIRRFELEKYFTLVGGASMDDTRSKKADVIAHVLRQLGAEDSARVLMVGDRKHDVLGAAAFGIDCVGVLYGYGSQEELEMAGARYIASTPGDIPRIVLGE
ncbi:MAG: HAD-IA family hydrolase [Clostridiales bacterium]|nr:HAD-IA family hydrolase [Clostridiales bacterium]